MFCDIGTPRATWNVYSELKAQLIERGVPAEAVRFVHEARNDREKAELFAQCRSGAVAVLVGSTEKMGVGTNIQARAIALHHLDCPWRPADIEQREGRILRQGNLNDEVEVLRYVTESSFDVFMWGTVERKAAFIAQVTLGGKDIARQVDDVGEQSLSYGEVKALATGNPLIMEKAGVDSEVAKLDRMAHAHGADQRRLTKTINSADRTIARLENRIAMGNKALGLRQDISGDSFSSTITGVACDKRLEAGERIKEALMDSRQRLGATIPIGNLAGLELEVTVHGDLAETSLHLHFPDAPVGLIVINAREIDDEHPVGLVRRLTNRLSDIESQLHGDTQELDATLKNVAQANNMIGQPFDQAGRLANLRARQAEITEALTPKPETEAERQPAPAPVREQASERPAEQAVHVGSALGSALDLESDLEMELDDDLSMPDFGL